MNPTRTTILALLLAWALAACTPAPALNIDSGVWCTFDAVSADILHQDEDQVEMLVTVQGFACEPSAEAAGGNERP